MASSFAATTTPPRPVALFRGGDDDANDTNSSFSKSKESTPSRSVASSKQELSSWKAKRDRWFGSPRPKLKPLPGATTITTTTTTSSGLSSSTTTEMSTPATDSLPVFSAKPLATNTIKTTTSTAQSLTSSLGSLSVSSPLSEKPTAKTKLTTTNESNTAAKTNPFGKIQLVPSKPPVNPFGNIRLVPAKASPTSPTKPTTTSSTKPANPLHLVASTKPIGQPAVATGCSFPTTTTTTTTTIIPATTTHKPPKPLSEAERAASNIFDKFDREQSGSLVAERFEDLSEALGEGFHGDEFDAQMARVDPSKSGRITRDNFVQWYKDLVEGNSDNDDDASLDTAELEERDEERQTAKKAFGSICQTDEKESFIQSDEFGKVIEALGSVYCEEEHKNTIQKLETNNGRIYESDFLKWYIDWLFGDGEDSDDDDDADDDEATSANKDPHVESLGSIFKVDESTWKCEICSVRNKDSLQKCAACETPRPGFEDTAAAPTVGPPSTSSIGAGGFSFGGAAAAAATSSIGATGFSFGGTATKPSTTTSSSIGATGFSFGGATGKTSTATFSSSKTGAGGFLFGGATAKPNTIAGSAAFPPMSKTAPTNPFGAKPATKTSAIKNTSTAAAFPPMSKTAPTNPFGAKPATKTSATKNTSASAAFPPMSKTAPTNPFGAKPTTKTSDSNNASANPFGKINLVASKTPLVAVPASSSLETKSALESKNKHSKTNPFGSISLVPSSKPLVSKPVEKSTNTQSSSSSYPPMSNAAPKNPFGIPSSKPAPKVESKSLSVSSSYPPMSSAAPKNPFGSTPAKSSSASSYPPMSSKAPKSPFSFSKTESKSTSDPFGSGMSSTTKTSFLSPQTEKTSVFGGTASGSENSKTNNEDYKTRLIKFYEKHNPSKVGTVDATLEKYKGKEDELFRKLEAKYALQQTTPQFPPPSGSGPKCYLEFTFGGNEKRRVVVKLYKDKAPLAVENFKCLCTGEITTHKAGGKPLRYLGSKVHRIVPGFCIQAGDFTTGNGRGGASIYAPNSEHGDAWGKFRDEESGFLNHSKKGLLSMANSGKNTNSSQFFFTLKAVPYLNGKHVIFGEVEEGMDILEEMSKVATDKASKPIQDVVISGCGEIDESGKDKPSLGSGESAESKSPFGGGVFGNASNGMSTFGASKTPLFGGSSSAFGSSTKSPFGTTSGAFGGTTSSAFGSKTTGASSTPVFGSPSKLGGEKTTSGSSAPVFGNTSTFGSNKSSAPIFGNTSTFGSNKSSTPVFGSPSTLGSTPSSAKPSVFGSASAFGGTGSSGGFGALAASAGDTPSFGKTFSVGLGSSSTPAFGSSSAFDGNTNKPSVFGGSSSSSSAENKGFSFGTATGNS